MGTQESRNRRTRTSRDAERAAGAARRRDARRGRSGPRAAGHGESRRGAESSAAVAAAATEPARADDHRPPRRQRLPPGAHLRLVPAGPRPGRATSSRPATSVPTKDGHLVCRHEPEIGGTTDVADHPEFAGRKTTKVLDGVSSTGWFTEDFTLAELKTLRAIERIPANRPHNTLYNGRWEIPTFEEVLRWQDEQTRKRGKQVWIYPETKHPTYFRKLGLGPGGAGRQAAAQVRQGQEELAGHPPVLRAEQHPAPEPAGRQPPRRPAVRRRTPAPGTSSRTGDPRTVADLVKPDGLGWIASYAQGIGPTLDLVIPKRRGRQPHHADHPRRGRPRRGPDPAPLHHAQREPLPARELPQGHGRGRLRRRLRRVQGVLRTGIDGVFTDNADTGCWPARTSSTTDPWNRTSTDDARAPVGVTPGRPGNPCRGGRVVPGI